MNPSIPNGWPPQDLDVEDLELDDGSGDDGDDGNDSGDGGHGDGDREGGTLDALIIFLDRLGLPFVERASAEDFDEDILTYSVILPDDLGDRLRALAEREGGAEEVLLARAIAIGLRALENDGKEG